MRLRRLIKDLRYMNTRGNNDVPFIYANDASFFLFPTTPNEIETFIDELDPKKSISLNSKCPNVQNAVLLKIKLFMI